MQRFHQLLFAVSLLALSWLGMMAVHELGHVVGAVTTGGEVTQVVLHPLAISRTDVAPNPHPAVVVWAGPILGCVLPILALALVPRRCVLATKSCHFFAGFCLLANGAYICIGSFEGVGDAGEMLQTGTPAWAMFVFGAVTVPAGLFLWHRLGSLRQFATRPDAVTARASFGACGLLVLLVLVEWMLSPR